jgi:hypothetical protein
MARTYGAIYVRIWRDQDFRDLDALEQYMYMTLCSQAKLNRAGLLEYSPRRWAEATRNLTSSDVEVLIKSLVQRRYVVLDEATNELLIRTYVRNDEAWKQPKVMAAVVSASKEIDSPLLRRALFLELDRIPVGELSDTPPANGGLSIRAKVEGYIAQLRVILRDPEPDGPARPARSNQPKSPSGSAPTDTPVMPEARGIDTPRVGEGTRARAHLAPEPVPEPVPEPTPLAYGALFDVPSPAETTAAAPPADEPPPAAEPERNAGTLIGEWLEFRGEERPPGKIIARTGKEVKTLLEDDRIPYDTVRRGLIEWDAKRCDPRTIASFVNQVQGNRPQPAAAAGPRPSATARAVQDGMDLIQRMAAEEGVDLATIIPFPGYRELIA